MSTTFGIHRRNESIELVNDELPIWFDHDDFIVIGFVTNSNTFVYINVLTPYLPDMTRVYPLDNTAQGIYTIYDLKRLNL